MIGGIHFLRGVAAFFVLIYHTYHVSNLYVRYNFDLFNVLYIGVDIFFVISGFVMFFILDRGLAKTSLSNYRVKFILDRVFRIVPLYWFFTITFYIINNVVYPEGSDKHINIPSLIKSLFFIPYGHLDEISSPVLGVGWTLNYEMFFYILILGSLFIGKHVYVSIILMVIGCVSLGFINYFSQFILVRYISNPIMLEFILGIWIGYVYVYKDDKLFLLSGFFLLLSVFYLLYGDSCLLDEYQRIILFGGASGFLVSMVLFISNKGYMQFALNNKFFYFLGSSSYVMYLIHHPILSFLGKAFNYFNAMNYIIVFYTFAFLVVYAVTYVVESVYVSRIEPLFDVLRGR